MPGAEFLDAHDLLWEIPPERWLEGIPLANGDIGGLIWGNGVPLHITMDKYDAWETREKGVGDLTYAKLRHMVDRNQRAEAEQCMRREQIYGDAPYPTRLPMPRIELAFDGPFVWREGRLQLRMATAEINATVDGEPLRIEALVHAEENVLFLRFEGTPAPKVRIQATLDHLDEGAKATLARWGYEAPEVTDTGKNGSLLFRSPTGYGYALAWRRFAAGDDEHTICVAIASTEDAEDPLDAAWELTKRAGSGMSLAPHDAWWSDYWTRSYLTIPDARLEALYYAEMYKLGCSSRPSKYPVTLQGLWTLDGGMPPWSGDYHLDMNVQQSYWPIYAANRLELGEPLYRTFSACIPKWREQCQAFFGHDGIWPGCAIGPRGERVFGYSGVELWPGNAAWLAHHYWLHFLYSWDKDFLRDEALPMIRLAFLTYAGILEADDDGTLHVPLSYSPEWGEGGFSAYCRDPNCDLALIRFLGEAIVKSSQILEAEDETAAKAAEVLDNLTDYVHVNGHLLISKGEPLTHSHRHHSHLMAIHPLGLITREGTEHERAFIRNALYDIRVKGPGEWTGWAFPWMSLIASRAGYGNMAWQMLDTYANAFIKPNTFHVNGDPRIFGYSLFTYEPMTLEAGFGAAAAVMEMLLQSFGGVIRLFPTTPDRWHDAYFHHLRAEGAFLVTAKLLRGDVLFVVIRSEAGQPCRIENPFDGEAELVQLAPEEDQGAPLRGAILAFDTEPGADYLLYPQGRKPTPQAMAPTEFPRTDRERNLFGVKRLPRF